MATKKDITTLFRAVRNGDADTVRAMVTADKELVHARRSAPPKKDDGQSPLQVAFKTGRFAIAKFLIDRAADVNFIEKSKVNEWRAPVLHDALRAGAFNAGEKDFRQAVALIKRMLKLGADPNAVDSFGNDCLARVILDARLILPHDPNEVYRETVRDIGVLFSTLIKAGADIHASSKRRPTSAAEETKGTFLARFVK